MHLHYCVTTLIEAPSMGIGYCSAERPPTTNDATMLLNFVSPVLYAVVDAQHAA